MLRKKRKCMKKSMKERHEQNQVKSRLYNISKIIFFRK